jgi:predicted NACHT family NTPase
VDRLPLDVQRRDARRRIEDTREHVFVTGRAGTGKSTLLQHLAWNTDKQIGLGLLQLAVGDEPDRQPEQRVDRLPLDVQRRDARPASTCS